MGWYRPTIWVPLIGWQQHKQSRSNHLDFILPSRGSSRLSYTDEFDFRVGFLCPFLQEGIPTRSCGHKTLRQGTAEPRAASKALNAALARLGLTPSNAIAAC